MIKTYDNFKIVTPDGTTYDMADDFNVLVRSFTIGSPRPEIETDKIDGTHGAIKLGKTWGERELSADCSFFAFDALDTPLQRNKLYRLLMSLDEFYIIVDAEPGKRWLVEVADSFAPSKVGTYGEFTVNFVCHSGFAESVGTTMDPMTFDSGLWQVGQGLTGEQLVYTQSTSTFSIFNAGDIPVDPRTIPLVITFYGTSTNLSIKNNTTGDEWTYTGTTSAQTIKLDGVKSTKSNVSIFANTNRKLITLKPGWNDFVITGATGTYTISFDFRFYYL